MTKTNEVRALKPREPKTEQLIVPLIGTSPLIVHRFSEKAKKEMLEKQTKTARGQKEARDPAAEAAAGEHLLPSGRPGFPVVGFKAALVDAARTVAGFKMTEIRQAVAVHGEPSAPVATAFEGALTRDMLCEIVVPPSERNIREDVVKIAMGTSMLRYRYEYARWATLLHVTYNAEFMSEDQLAQIIYEAGSAVGVGEWRPERGGIYGTFRIGNMEELEALIRQRDDEEAAAARSKVRVA